jgi:hypothetical protein
MIAYDYDVRDRCGIMLPRLFSTKCKHQHPCAGYDWSCPYHPDGCLYEHIKSQPHNIVVTFLGVRGGVTIKGGGH